MNPPPRYLQFGCGPSCPVTEDWVHYDASPTLFLQRFPLAGCLFRRVLKPRFDGRIRHGDILKNLPPCPGDYAGIYSSHVLEHFSLEDLRLALKNVHALLAPGGVFRLVMPDLAQLAEEYTSSDDTDAAILFMQKTGLGAARRERSLMGLLRSYLGNAHHRWLWDFKSIQHELEQAGFSQVRRAYFGDSADPRFSQVEDETRWQDCLGVECRRPG